jgi:hypothetical protein
MQGKKEHLMLTPEEVRVLNYLRRQLCAGLKSVVQSCLPGSTPAWVERVVSDLEWLGYVTVYHGADGQPVTLEITENGLHG